MKDKINSLQILRAFFALVVVVRHVLYELSLFDNNNSELLDFYQVLHFGSIGVDGFFVISGFIMYYVHSDDFLKPSISFKFLLRRFLRIAPLYWILTSLTLLIMLFFPSSVNDGKEINIPHVLASYLFVPWENSIGLHYPPLAPGWSLNFEMYFYLIFSLFLFFPKKYFVTGISLIFFISVLFNQKVIDFPILNMITDPMLIEFLLGIFIGIMFRKKYLSQKPILLVLISIIIVSLNIFIRVDHEFRLFSYGIPSALLIFSLLCLENKFKIKFNRFFMFLGTISYSLYLSHVFSYKLIYMVLSSGFIINNADLTIVISISFSILVATFVYFMIEKPFEIFAKRLRLKYNF